jgi:glycosyltransferase involved in cell wall biosynthesis
MTDVHTSSATVVVSTYNRPQYLVRVLEAFEHQSRKDFEIVVADDGSNQASRDAVDRYIADSALDVRCVWQEDKGFRKTAILNKAVADARTDYLIFTDGDCIPFPDFIELHLAFRAPGTYLSAGSVRLSEGATASIVSGFAASPEIFRWGKLVELGQPARIKSARMFLPFFLRRVLDRLVPIKTTFNGLNSSCWKADLEKVGGFNEAMGYGSEDVEFGIRLQATGVRPVRVRHRIRTLHLDHDRPYAAPSEILRNFKIKEATLRSVGPQLSKHKP